MSPENWIKTSKRTVDTAHVIAVFVVFALLLAGSGFGLVGVGVAVLLRGEVAGLLGLAIGVLILFGAYLFGRVAWRTRRASRELRPGTAGRRKRARAMLASAVAMAAGSVFMPFPVPVRVISIIMAFLVLPLLLAFEFEPPKRKQTGRRG